MTLFRVSAFLVEPDNSIGLTTLLFTAFYSVFLKVVAFNGKPVKNLKSLAAMVESCDDEYLKFDLDYEQVRLYFSICLVCSWKMALSNSY